MRAGFFSAPYSRALAGISVVVGLRRVGRGVGGGRRRGGGPPFLLHPVEGGRRCRGAAGEGLWADFLVDGEAFRMDYGP